MRTKAATFLLIALTGLSTACLSGCAEDQSVHIITDAEWENIGKLRGGKFTLVSNDDLAALRRDAELGKNVGRYRTERTGFRTWRLDTATGRTCLLFTTPDDWNKPGASLEGCAD